jgi:hypothetical protein
MEANRLDARFVSVVLTDEARWLVIWDLKHLHDAIGTTHDNMTATWRKQGYIKLRAGSHPQQLRGRKTASKTVRRWDNLFGKTIDIPGETSIVMAVQAQTPRQLHLPGNVKSFFALKDLWKKLQATKVCNSKKKRSVFEEAHNDNLRNGLGPESMATLCRFLPGPEQQ